VPRSVILATITISSIFLLLYLLGQNEPKTKGSLGFVVGLM